MTGNAMQTKYQIGGAVAFGENPLFDKLRAKFHKGNRTVGEKALLRAIKEGFNPYENTVKAPAKKRPPTAKNSITKPASAPALRARQAAGVKAGSRASAINNAKTRRIKDKTPFPIGAIILIVICAIMLAFVIYSGVLINQMTREVSELQKMKASLCSKEEGIVLSLEEKNDLRVIERIATKELGMVKQDQVMQKYINMSSGDRIEVFSPTEDESSNVGTALLSAISKNIGNLLEYLD